MPTAAPLKTYYLARHGQVEEAFHGIFYGWLDPGLSDLGHQQAGRLAHHLNTLELAFDACYSSDLQRCHHSLQTMALHGARLPDPLVLPGLREKNMGKAEGLPFHQVLQQYPHLHPKGRNWLEVEEGESLTQFTGRVQTAWEEVRRSAPAGNSLIMCHGGVIRVVVAHLLHCPLRALSHMRVDHCSLTIIEEYEDSLALRSLNRQIHLS